jgi:hypothetical protein
MAVDPADIVREMRRLKSVGVPIKEILPAILRTFPTSTTAERLLASVMWMGKDSPKTRAAIPEMASLIDAGPAGVEALAKAAVEHLFPDMTEEQVAESLREDHAASRKAAH